MGVRMTNVTHLPPLTRPGQSAPESHCQKITLKIESKWKHFTARTEELSHIPSLGWRRTVCLCKDEGAWIPQHFSIHQRCNLGREADSRNLSGSRQVWLLLLHKAAHHSHPFTRQKMDPSREGIYGCLQHPRSRPSTHPPPCQQDQTHRCGTRWQVGISDQSAWGVAWEEIVHIVFLSYDAIPRWVLSVSEKLFLHLWSQAVEPSDITYCESVFRKSFVENVEVFLLEGWYETTLTFV